MTSRGTCSLAFLLEVRSFAFYPDFIDKVRESNDIVEVIGQYTALKGSPHNMMGRCPFPDHPDKSPSFSVNEDKQLFFCHGCKKGGTIFTFLEAFNGMSFPEALEYLARRASIPLPEKEESPNAVASRTSKDLLLKINRAAAVFYHNQMKGLPTDHPVWMYAEKRGLSADVFEKFRLGVSSSDWQGLYNHFKSLHVPIEAADLLGLIKAKKTAAKGDSHYDLFRERLMFPIFSSTGDVIGFGGRTLEPDGLPKYLNSHESPVFHKGKTFYGIHETGKFIRAADYAIVVEGYMDAIALYSAGITNVVAILGTAFTADHAKAIKRYTMNVVMLLDGDEAGLNGAERSLPILLEAGVMAKGFAIPDKMDPDEYVRARGAEKLRSEVQRAPELFKLLLTRRWMQGYHASASEKVRVAEEAVKVLAKAQNQSLIDLYLLELARQIDVDMTWVRKALQKVKPIDRKGGPIPVGEKSRVVVVAPRVPLKEEPPAFVEPINEINEGYTPEVKIVLKDAPRDEIYVVSLLLHYENLMKELVAAGPEQVYGVFTSLEIRHLLAMAVEKYRARPQNFTDLAASLVGSVDNPGRLLVAMTKGESPSTRADGIEKQLLSDYMTAITLRSLKAQAKVIAVQMRQNEVDGGAKKELLEAFMEIQKQILELEKREI